MRTIVSIGGLLATQVGQQLIDELIAICPGTSKYRDSYSTGPLSEDDPRLQG
jgi:hypothetical protein